MGFNFGLGGGLVSSGIDFLSQVNSNGVFVYTASTAANSPFVLVLSTIFGIMGLLSLYWVFRILESNDWRIQMF